MQSFSSDVAWRTVTGGRNVTDWMLVTPSPGSTISSGSYVFDTDGSIALAGTSVCSSSDFGVTWACQPAVDAGGADAGMCCSGARCVVV